VLLAAVGGGVAALRILGGDRPPSAQSDSVGVEQPPAGPGPRPAQLEREETEKGLEKAEEEFAKKQKEFEEKQREVREKTEKELEKAKEEMVKKQKEFEEQQRKERRQQEEEIDRKYRETERKREKPRSSVSSPRSEGNPEKQKSKPKSSASTPTSVGNPRTTLSASDWQAHVSLKTPYPQSYRGAPTDRISVQYAAIELLKQAGIEYDFKKSQANVGELARRWIQPNIVDQPCATALDQVLGSVGLTYELVDSKVVLKRK
jgi:hypothetical protein